MRKDRDSPGVTAWAPQDYPSAIHGLEADSLINRKYFTWQADTLSIHVGISHRSSGKIISSSR